MPSKVPACALNNNADRDSATFNRSCAKNRIEVESDDTPKSQELTPKSQSRRPQERRVIAQGASLDHGIGHVQHAGMLGKAFV